MSIAEIQLPDGRTVEIEVPEGVTEAEILAFVKEQYDSGAFGDAQTGLDSAPVNITPAEANQQALAQEQKPGFVDGVLSDLYKRVGTVQEFSRNLDNSLVQAPALAGVALGQTSGFAGDVIGSGLGKVAGAIVPESVKKFATETTQDILQTEVGQMGLQALQKGIGAYNQFREAYPNEAIALDSALNLLGLGAAKKGAQGAVSAGTKLGAAALDTAPGRMAIDAAEVAKTQAGKFIEGMPADPLKSASYLKKLAKQTDSKVEKAITAIKPAFKKVGTEDQRAKYNANARRAFNKILDYKPELKLLDEGGEFVSKLPETLGDLQRAGTQTAKRVFQQYDKMAKNVGDDAFILGDTVTAPLDDVIESVPLKLEAPSVIKYAEAKKAKYKDELITMEEAQETIKILNESLETYYSKPSKTTKGKAMVDALVANNMRKQIDDIVTSFEGPGYAGLKKDYGAVKTLLEDVNKAVYKQANSGDVRLPTFTDVIAGNRVVEGIVGSNAGTIAGGAFLKAVEQYRKALRNPDKKIKQMFEYMEKEREFKQKAGRD